jgi:hypothetical protein
MNYEMSYTGVALSEREQLVCWLLGYGYHRANVFCGVGLLEQRVRVFDRGSLRLALISRGFVCLGLETSGSSHGLSKACEWGLELVLPRYM